MPKISSDERPDDPGAQLSPALAQELNERLSKQLPRPEQRQMVIEIVESTVSHSGPVPPPAMIKQYDDILPGAAERIFAMAEREQAHLHEMDQRAIRQPHNAEMLGMVIGGLIVAAAITASFFLIVAGHSLTGSLFSGGLLLTIALAYVKRARNGPQAPIPPPRKPSKQPRNRSR